MEKNYQKYNDIMENNKDRLMITPTVNMHNWFSMADMFRWINENNAAIGGRLNVLHLPVWQSISRMPQEYLDIGYKDMLDVETKIYEISKVKIIFHQSIIREKDLLIDSKILITPVNGKGKIVKMPVDMLEKLQLSKI